MIWWLISYNICIIDVIEIICRFKYFLLKSFIEQKCESVRRMTLKSFEVCLLADMSD